MAMTLPIIKLLLRVIYPLVDAKTTAFFPRIDVPKSIMSSTDFMHNFVSTALCFLMRRKVNSDVIFKIIVLHGFNYVDFVMFCGAIQGSFGRVIIIYFKKIVV